MNYISKVRVALAKKIDVEDELLQLYTLLVFTRGVRTTWEDVHDAWAVCKSASAPEHKSLIPFDQLSEEVQKLDQEYAHAIKEVAAELNPRGIKF